MNYTIKNNVIFSYLFSEEDIVKDFLEAKKMGFRLYSRNELG